MPWGAARACVCTVCKLLSNIKEELNGPCCVFLVRSPCQIAQTVNPGTLTLTTLLKPREIVKCEKGTSSKPSLRFIPQVSNSIKTIVRLNRATTKLTPSLRDSPNKMQLPRSYLMTMKKRRERKPKWTGPPEKWQKWTEIICLSETQGKQRKDTRKFFFLQRL